jgi:hypothetical protein
LLISTVGFSQKKSIIYDSKGKLMVDTSFVINQMQLTKWIEVEDSLSVRIMNRIHCAPILKDNEIQAQIVVSFTIDSIGRFNDFRIERSQSQSISDTSKMYWKFLEMYSASIFQSVLWTSQDFVSSNFIASSSVLEKYFLPFEFSYDDKPGNMIRNGWIKLINKKNNVIHDPPVILNHR